MTEFRIGNLTIKFIHHKTMPINSTTLETKHTKIEIYQKGILGRSKLIYTRKYMPLPALTISGLFRDIERLEKKDH